MACRGVELLLSRHEDARCSFALHHRPTVALMTTKNASVTCDGGRGGRGVWAELCVIRGGGGSHGV